jgi:hypothetical protein
MKPRRSLVTATGAVSQTYFAREPACSRVRRARKARRPGKAEAAHLDASLVAEMRAAQESLVEDFLLEPDSSLYRKREGRRPNRTCINGFSIGYKWSNGRPTPELCLKVYVDKKHALRSDVAPSARIPTRWKSFKTDIVERRAYRLANTLPEPLNPSDLVTHRGTANNVGTMACFVRNQTQLFLMSASHVIAPSPWLLGGGCAPNDAIDFVTGGSAYLIGLLEPGYSVLDTSNVHQTDAAIARTDPAAANTLLPNGQRISPIIPPTLTQGMLVKKYGYNGYGEGQLVDVHSVENVSCRDRQGKPCYVRFGDQVGVVGSGGSAFAGPGDSGALVITYSTNQPVGMVIAHVGPYTLMTPIRRVLSQFNVQLVV